MFDISVSNDAGLIRTERKTITTDYKDYKKKCESMEDLHHSSNYKINPCKRNYIPKVSIAGGYRNVLKWMVRIMKKRFA